MSINKTRGILYQIAKLLGGCFCYCQRKSEENGEEGRQKNSWQGHRKGNEEAV